MAAEKRCVLTHPHPGQECRDPRTVYRNRWGGAPTRPPVDDVPGQLDLLAGGAA